MIRKLAIALLFIGGSAQAQSVPMCTEYGYDSAYRAEQFIQSGDAAMANVFDCYGDNFYACQTAHNYYTDAYQHIMGVFNGTAVGWDSGGRECLNCNISALHNLAIALKIRHEQLSDYGYYPSLIQPYDTISYYFIHTPVCPAAPPQPSAPRVAPRDTGCDSIDRTAGAGLPGYNMVEIPNISVPECTRRCQDDARCKSFDWNKNNGNCMLQNANKFDQPLSFDYAGDPWDHFHCMGR